jgi:hypothetical protein
MASEMPVGRDLARPSFSLGIAARSPAPVRLRGTLLPVIDLSTRCFLH